MEDFIYKTGMNVHKGAKIDLLDVDAFVIYPGTDRIESDVILARRILWR